MTEDVKLPPMPEAEFILDGTMSQDGYAADHMSEYARLAVLQERERIALQAEALAVEYCDGNFRDFAAAIRSGK